MYTAFSLGLGLIIGILITLFLFRTGIMESIAGDESGIIARLLLFVFIFVASFCISFLIIDKAFAQNDYTDAYITTKQEFPIYKKIAKTSDSEEIGTLKKGTVLKVMKAKREKAQTWVEGYVLMDNKAKYTTILIPAKVQIKENGTYFDFNEKSSEFTSYCEYIDSENAKLLETIKDEFLKELSEKGITVEFSLNKIAPLTIKKSHYVLPQNGYNNKGFFGVYELEDTSYFYYIEKKYKDDFKKIVNKYYKKLEIEKKQYFEPRRK